MMDFDATSLYPPALHNEKSVYHKIESGFVFISHLNDVYVEVFNNGTFNQDGNEGAILKIKYYSPPDLIFQHLPVEEKIKITKVTRKQNEIIIDTSTSVDIQSSIKIGGKVIRFYEGVVYRGNFKVSSFEKVIESLFLSRQKYKDKRNDLMQNLVRLLLNSLYGVQIRRDIFESFKS